MPFKGLKKLEGKLISYMRTILKSKELTNGFVVRDYAENFAPNARLFEKKYGSEIKGINGDTTEWMLNGICIEHRDQTADHSFEIDVQHDFPFFKMHFEMKGYSDYLPQNKGSKSVVIEEGRHQVFYFPEVKGRLRYAPGQRYTLEIKLTQTYFEKFFGEDLSNLGRMGTCYIANQPGTLGENSLEILPKMKPVIHEIINCPFAGPLRKVFLETKVTELLLMQLQQIEQSPAPEPESVLRSGDVERLHHVKDLIHLNLQEPCSLLELSQKAGLNDFKLKKGFKELFGNTVFGYMTEVRMEKAKQMLLTGNHSIADISFTVGYKNPQHFTAAFKRRYGFLPRDIKK